MYCYTRRQKLWVAQFRRRSRYSWHSLKIECAASFDGNRQRIYFRDRPDSWTAKRIASTLVWYAPVSQAQKISAAAGVTGISESLPLLRIHNSWNRTEVHFYVTTKFRIHFEMQIDSFRPFETLSRARLGWKNEFHQRSTQVIHMVPKILNFLFSTFPSFWILFCGCLNIALHH